MAPPPRFVRERTPSASIEPAEIERASLVEGGQQRASENITTTVEAYRALVIVTWAAAAPLSRASREVPAPTT